MTPSDSKPFRTAMAELYALYDRPADEVRTKLYWNELREFPLEAVQSAMAKAKRECEFFPAVAKLRSYIVGTSEVAAEAAWLALTEAIRRFGFYRTPELPETVLQACEAVYGGWQNACREVPSPSGRDFEDHRRRFLAAYRVVEVRQLSALPPAVLKLLETS